MLLNNMSARETGDTGRDQVDGRPEGGEGDTGEMPREGNTGETERGEGHIKGDK